jgi:hypothetical protein
MGEGEKIGADSRCSLACTPWRREVAVDFFEFVCCCWCRNCGRKLTGRWIGILVKKCALNCVLDIAVGASDVAKWSGRSAWWRLGCGGLVLSFVLVLDICAELFLRMLLTGL